MQLDEPKRDTACFSSRQWFVGKRAFTTKEDANAAIRLAEEHASDVREELLAELRDWLWNK